METPQEKALKQPQGWNRKITKSFGQDYNRKEAKRAAKKGRAYQIKHF